MTVFNCVYVQDHSVLSADGGSATTDWLVLDWTLGETIVESGYTTDKMYSQGFHQPWITIQNLGPSINLKKSDSYVVNVRPNPVRTTFNSSFAEV